jgi:ER membrane protein complex subunit 1
MPTLCKAPVAPAGCCLHNSDLFRASAPCSRYSLPRDILFRSLIICVKPVLDALTSPLSTMRFYALLTLVLSCVSSVYSILADEAYHVDYYHSLLGVPQSETTFFHRPSATSNASLLYTISEKAILGAVSPRDGSLVWRQSLAGPLPKPHLVVEDVAKLPEEEPLKAFRDEGPAKAGLLAEEGTGLVVSYYGSTVSTWDAMNGKLVWQRVMPERHHVKSAQLVPNRRGKSSSSAADIVVLYGTVTGTILRLKGSSGEVVWEHTDMR